MRLFFSYARPDRPRADLLVTRLRQAGIEVWLDSDLIGGWPWWDKILGQLRSCDAVLAAVSRASIGSQACRAERAYAMQLGKPVLPIALERVPAALFPADIASIQVIDYTEPDESAAFRLAGAIYSLPKARPLPFPLPDPPAVPRTRFGDLNDRIAEPTLTMGRQLGIIGVLEEALAPTSDPDDRLIAIEMLREMARRRDLYAGAARKIEALLGQPGDSAPERGPRPAATARPDGSGQAEALPPRGEATQPPPPRAEPASAKPAPAEPALAKPAPAEPAPAEPAPAKPAQARPGQAEPAVVPWWRAERPEGRPPPPPARSGLASSPPVRPESASSPPARFQAADPEPAHPEPAAMPPISHEPAATPLASSPPATSGGSVNEHRVLAITSAVLTFMPVVTAPVGVFALRSSSRVKASLAVQDLAGAQREAARVVIAFWLAIGLWVVGAIIAATG